MTEFENLICKRIKEENDKVLHMGCLVVHSVELHPSFDYGWGVDENGNVSHHITIEDVGMVSYAHVFGVACDGGKGPRYVTIALNPKNATRELEREWKIRDWENQKIYCTVAMDMYRRYRFRSELIEALRAGKRYARLARKYA